MDNKTTTLHHSGDVNVVVFKLNSIALPHPLCLLAQRVEVAHVTEADVVFHRADPEIGCSQLVAAGKLAFQVGLDPVHIDFAPLFPLLEQTPQLQHGGVDLFLGDDAR